MNMVTLANIRYLYAEPWMRLSHALVDLRSMVGVENQKLLEFASPTFLGDAVS